tara:strand:- start:2065 stop:2790 length:726 start_codon:yes stop_codon:yes gene_type:complete
MTTLSCINLTKEYTGKKVVNDVSVNVNTGKVVGLLGPNGAGKTTTFYMLVGLIKSDSGEIKIDNQVVTSLPMHTRSNLGISYLPQEASIFKNLTVEENILAILEVKKNLSKKEQIQKLNNLIEMLQIGNITKNNGASLSGGERRRVEIARALAIEPKFLLLDEPFAGIDPLSVIEIQKIIKSLAKSKIGVLITDHNVRETLKVCDESYILSDGKVIAHGKPKEIVKNQLVQNVYLGDSFKL